MVRMSKERLKRLDGSASLIPRLVIIVRVASFTFRFGTLEQLRECLKYYQKKTRPSSRIAARTFAADIGQDWRELRGWEVERWFERLPMYLLEEPKRQKVIKALSKTLELIEKQKLRQLVNHTVADCGIGRRTFSDADCHLLIAQAC
jgi:hypothetical protein